MFKDDRMISILSAIVLMVAVGTVIQRADGLSQFFGGGEAAGPEIALVDDALTVRANTLTRIDVLANDKGLTRAQKAGLTVTGAPRCGRLFVQGDALQFLPDASCVGERVIAYTVPGLEQARVVVTVESDGSIATPAPPAEPGGTVVASTGADADQPTTERRVVAAKRPERQVVYKPSQAPSGEAETENATEQVLRALTQGASETAEARVPEPEAEAPTVTFQPAPQPTAPDPDETLAALDVAKGSTAPTTTQRRVEPIAHTPDQVAAPNLPSPDPLEALGFRNFQPDEPAGNPGAPQDHTARVDVAALAQDPRAGQPVTDLPLPESGKGFLVAVIDLQEPTTEAPEAPADLPEVAEQADVTAERAGPGAVRVAALAPELSPEASGGLGQALTDQPIDAASVEPPVVADPEPVQPGEDDTEVARLAPAEEEGASDAPLVAPIPVARRPEPAPESLVPCEIPPAMTIDVRRGARTVVSVIADCQANTVAELHYSGLRLAVPLDANGRGQATVLGFEANAPALMIFRNGEKIDFDLPFKGINRVSRVALVWDLPITLELNALEFGAGLDSEGHVRPANPRSFDDVRREGGGFLSSYRSAYGKGQNIEIYTHWARRSGDSGIVKMMVDFASRNRDRLQGTCGTGPYAAPQFLIMRSIRGRVERPILRRLAALDCSRITQETGDKRLISGAVDDLVITRK